MALTESSTIGSITVTVAGHLEVRRDDHVTRDGIVIATTYHRHVLAPGDDITAEDARVAAIASVVWTPETIATYRATREPALTERTPDAE